MYQQMHRKLHTSQQTCLLPLNRFHVLLTLSSECFSTFPHGTCLLLVSRLYLALDGVYHLLWAAFPNNPTRKNKPIDIMLNTLQVLNLLWNSNQRELRYLHNAIVYSYTLQFAAVIKPQRFSAELIPFHSQLLRESLLVSFPPLTDMLKFSG